MKLTSHIIGDMLNHTIVLFDKFSNFIGDLAFENFKYKHGFLLSRQFKLNLPFLTMWKKHPLQMLYCLRLATTTVCGIRDIPVIWKLCTFRQTAAIRGPLIDQLHS